jgi:hypothetical protein
MHRFVSLLYHWGLVENGYYVMPPETQTLLDLTFFAPNSIPDDAQQKTLDFWAEENAMSSEVAATRVKLVIGHATLNGQLIGVASGLVGLSKNLDQPYFYYRSYIATSQRQQGYGTALLGLCFDELSVYFKAQPRPAAIGVLLEIPGNIAPLNRHLVWPKTQFTFAGKLKNGTHQRVRYFEQVRMFQRSQ